MKGSYEQQSVGRSYLCDGREGTKDNEYRRGIKGSTLLSTMFISLKNIYKKFCKMLAFIKLGSVYNSLNALP